MTKEETKIYQALIQLASWIGQMQASEQFTTQFETAMKSGESIEDFSKRFNFELRASLPVREIENILGLERYN